MVASITTLGAGSGIELQSILEQLREIDQAVVDRKVDDITKAEEQLDEFSVVQNKLIDIKSVALDLSLATTYISRTFNSTDEDVATGIAGDGATVGGIALKVDQLAEASTWLSASGKETADSYVYIPSRQESTTGVSDAAATVVAYNGESIGIDLGGTSNFTVDFSSTTTLDEMVSAINDHSSNVGGGENGRLVTAETFVSEGQTFLRIRSDDPTGNGEANRVTLTDNVAAIDFVAPDVVLKLQVGDGDEVSLLVPPNTTMNGLVSLINDPAGNPGVKAEIINDGDSSTPYRLTLKSNLFGEQGRIAFNSQLPDLVMEEKQGAAGVSLNAQFSVDGINYQRQTNSVDDVLNGVTISLEKEGTTTITVGNSKEKVKEQIANLVTAYNDAVQEIRTNSTYDPETGNSGLLSSTSIRNIPNSLQALMTGVITRDENNSSMLDENIIRTFNYTGSGTTYTEVDNNIYSLFDLGMEFNRDGTIGLDESVLSDALNYPETVQNFFLGDPSKDIEGFADKLNDQLRIMTRGDSQLSGEEQATEARISDLQSTIEQENVRLDRKYDLLKKQFIALDGYMNQMTSMSNFLTSQFDSLSKGWGNGD